MSGQVEVEPFRRVLPAVPLVIRLLDQSMMLGVDAQSAMAPMVTHLISTDDLPFQDAADDLVGVGLRDLEDDFAGAGGKNAPSILAKLANDPIRSSTSCVLAWSIKP